LVLAGVAGSGCFAWGVERAAVDVIHSQTAVANERAALIRQYRECLKSAETDPKVDCSGYETAFKAVDGR
jgi:hypothetical protein